MVASQSIACLAPIIGPAYISKHSALGAGVNSPPQAKQLMAGTREKARSIWVYNPWLDLVVGCGAWSAPLLLLSYFSIASNTRIWAVAFYGLALFCNYPHYMATIYRAYHRAEDFHKYRVFTLHMTAVVLLTLFLSHFWLRILPWIFTIYLTWSPWHYSGQNYGLFMMFARRAGANPDKAQRRALYGAFIASYLVLLLGFHTGPSSDPLFLSLGIPAIVSRWEQIMLGLVFVALSIYGLSGLARATGWRKLLPALTLFSSQFLWFVLPVAVSVVKGLAIPQSRYSSGVMAVMHSAQYLWITSHYARREAAEENRPKWRVSAYFVVLVTGGIALFVPGPWLASRVFHHDFIASFLIFTAVVNIHHFILDGAIWKLRDGRIAALLLNSRERFAEAATGARGRFVTGWSWLTGSTAGARFLRAGTAILLLTWGTVDQLRYYLALRADNLHDLQQAAALDSFDSSLQMRLAHREMEDGHLPEAEVAWRKAIQANPADPAPRQDLLRFLIDQNRFDEAFDLTQSSLIYVPKDPNLLVDRGLLALRRGDTNQAVADWERAIAIDPTQISARLYLADELDRENKPLAAAAHYKTYLSQITRRPTRNRPQPQQVIALVLRMGDCQKRASQTSQALQSFQLAEKLGAQTGQSRLEAIADINEAALQRTSGNIGEALRLYQHALQLDDASADRRSSAQDWFTFGQFLDAEGFPSRLVYACYVKSESLKSSLPDAFPTHSLEAFGKQIEKGLGTQAVAIRRDPEPFLREALALRQ
jgi:tetratricopeptide (TPR) repeat protein